MSTLGIDVLGADVLGAFDIAIEQRKMNALKNVNSTQAQSLLRAGYAAMDVADKVGTSDRKGRRVNIRGKLNWHTNELKKYALGVPYPPGDDLKKWVMEAFIEANVSAEGREYLDNVQRQLWSDLGSGLVDAVTNPIKTLTGVPGWVWTAGGAVVVGLLGFAAYKVLVAAAPTAAAVYLGRGRR